MTDVAIRSFRDLRVWQTGMDLVEQIYRMTYAFPQNELYGLTSQMQRAAVSIPSNIAEGHSRQHTKSYLYHLSVAQGSLAELETQIEVAFRLHYIDDRARGHLLDRMTSLGKQLHALRKALQRQSSS